jgi:hypothetical protein
MGLSKLCGFELRPGLCMMNYLEGLFYVPHRALSFRNKMTAQKDEHIVEVVFIPFCSNMHK